MIQPALTGITRAGTVTISPEGLRIENFAFDGVDLAAGGVLACRWATGRLLENAGTPVTWEMVDALRRGADAVERAQAHEDAILDCNFSTPAEIGDDVTLRAGADLLESLRPPRAP